MLFTLNRSGAAKAAPTKILSNDANAMPGFTGYVMVFTKCFCFCVRLSLSLSYKLCQISQIIIVKRNQETLNTKTLLCT